MINLNNTSFDACLKCTVCNAYCPVARATPDYPGPKYSGPDAERLRIKTPCLADQSLSLCNNCKRCEIVCPSGVRITDFIYQAKNSRLQSSKKLRDLFLTTPDLAGQIATRFSFLANPILRFRPVQAALRSFLSISDTVNFPRFARGTFAARIKKQRTAQKTFSRTVLYFHGCYVNYYDHELGQKVVKVLNALDIGVLAPRQKCCGVPLIAAGNFSRVRKNGRFNIARLIRGAADTSENKIVFSSSSCILTIKHDYANLLELDNSEIYHKLEFITRFLVKEFKRGNRPRMKPLRMTAAYHAPCHLERLGGVIHTIEMLRIIPGLQLHLLHSECCGIAGTYGFKKEHQLISRDIGRQLFQQIGAIDPDIVITDCETCKWQIETNTGYRVLHPVAVLAEAILPSADNASVPDGDPT